MRRGVVPVPEEEPEPPPDELEPESLPDDPPEESRRGAAVVGGAGLEETSARLSRSVAVAWAEVELELGEGEAVPPPAEGALRAGVGEADSEFTAISGPRSTAPGRAEAMATPTAASRATTISAMAALSAAPVSFMSSMVPEPDEPMMRTPPRGTRNR